MAPTRRRSKTTAVERIANDSTRRATFKKRRGGLLKKASELSTLCGVDACVVVYAEEGEPPAPPEVWPSAAEAARIIGRFRAMPDLDQCKKMMDQEAFMRERVAKLQEQVRKAAAENREREARLLLHSAVAGRCPGLFGLAIDKIASLGWMVERRIKEVHGRIDYLREQGVEESPQPQPAASAYSVSAEGEGCPFVEAPGAGGELDGVAYGGVGAGYDIGAGYACGHSDLCFPPV